MKAFEHYGSQCKGCGCYAEFCHCVISRGGELLKVISDKGQPLPLPKAEKDSYHDIF